MLIPRLKPEQKGTAAVTTEAHIVSDDNTEAAVYMTPTPCLSTPQLLQINHSMLARTLLLLCAASFFCADAVDQSGLYRRPSCVGASVTQACPLNYSPVCGSDGVTYPNECSLCVQRLEKNTDILVVKDGPC
ncbi:serine protease inhibitor Kazal-type 2-like [Aulostomus maculatus]